jgi:glycosyltransferase involved in cell wall biosynthesis
VKTTTESGRHDLSLVIACYNDGPILERNIDETLRLLDRERIATELIIVDDCSEDDTPAAVERVMQAQRHRRCVSVRHPTNLGRGRTVADGIGLATAPLVGFLDIDLEVHARYIPHCLSALADGYDVATGLRQFGFSWRSADRFVMSRGYRLLMQTALDVPLQDSETGFKFFRRDAILPILAQTRDPGWFWDTEIMVRAYMAGLRISEVPVVFERRWERPSTVKPIQDSVRHLLKLSAFRRELRGLRRAAR